MALDETQRTAISDALRGGLSPWDAVGLHPMEERQTILDLWDLIPLEDKRDHVLACKDAGRTAKDAARLLYLDLQREILPIWRAATAVP